MIAAEVENVLALLCDGLEESMVGDFLGKLRKDLGR